MGRLFETIDADLQSWIEQQHMFFVGTAPNDADGHINTSPKGAQDTFKILGPTSVAYLDMFGSGAETAAHLRENGRIVLMFCAFDGPPKVVRLHGRGRVVQAGDNQFDDLLQAFQPRDEVLAILRSFIAVDVTRISDSCGFVVPRMQVVEERQQLFKWGENQHKRNGHDWREKYMLANNTQSIDGLPALDVTTDLEEADVQAFSSTGRAL